MNSIYYLAAVALIESRPMPAPLIMKEIEEIRGDIGNIWCKVGGIMGGCKENQGKSWKLGANKETCDICLELCIF